MRAIALARTAGPDYDRGRTVSFGRAAVRWRGWEAKAVTTPIPFTPDPTAKPEVTGFFDADTNTISYLVRDPASDACAVIDSVMDIDYAAGRITHQGADRIVADDPRPRAETGMDHRDPCPRRSSVGRPLYPRGARRQARHRCRNHHGAGDVRQDLQRGYRVPARRLAIRPAVQGRRQLSDRLAHRACAAYARPHAGLHDACRRRRRLHRRHAVHARRRLGACRFPRR